MSEPSLWYIRKAQSKRAPALCNPSCPTITHTLLLNQALCMGSGVLRQAVREMHLKEHSPWAAGCGLPSAAILERLA